MEMFKTDGSSVMTSENVDQMMIHPTKFKNLYTVKSLIYDNDLTKRQK